MPCVETIENHRKILANSYLDFKGLVGYNWRMDAAELTPSPPAQRLCMWGTPLDAVQADKGQFVSAHPTRGIGACTERGMEAFSSHEMHEAALVPSTIGNVIALQKPMARHLQQRKFAQVTAINANRAGGFAERFTERLRGAVSRGRPRRTKDSNDTLHWQARQASQTKPGS